ncbi:hypothetical protein, partial [Acinetobacter baumannii]|uniref:hypothetical protein n=1 Tax=Acinetobacter baumannii TaxID=470 RepID=UPI0011126BE8
MAALKLTRHAAGNLAELIMLVALACLPLFLGHSAYAMGLLTLLAIYAIALIGLDATVGYLGQVHPVSSPHLTLP